MPYLRPKISLNFVSAALKIHKQLLFFKIVLFEFLLTNWDESVKSYFPFGVKMAEAGKIDHFAIQIEMDGVIRNFYGLLRQDAFYQQPIKLPPSFNIDFTYPFFFYKKWAG